MNTKDKRYYGLKEKAEEFALTHRRAFLPLVKLQIKRLDNRPFTRSGHMVRN